MVPSVQMLHLSAYPQRSALGPQSCRQLHSSKFSKKSEEHIYCPPTSNTVHKEHNLYFLVECCTACGRHCGGRGGGYNHTYADFLTPQARVFFPYQQRGYAAWTSVSCADQISCISVETQLKSE